MTTKVTDAYNDTSVVRVKVDHLPHTQPTLLAAIHEAAKTTHKCLASEQGRRQIIVHSYASSTQGLADLYHQLQELEHYINLFNLKWEWRLH